MKKLILFLILCFIVSILNSSFLSSNMKVEEEVKMVISQLDKLYYGYSNTKYDDYILSYTKDRNNKSNLGFKEDVKLLSTSLNVVANDKNKNKLKVTKVNDNVIVNNRYSYIASNGPYSLLGKAYNGGYIFFSNLGLPYYAGFYMYAKKINSKAIIKSRNDELINKDNKTLYIFTGDWMLNSVYNKNFTDVDPVTIDDGHRFFNGNDYKLAYNEYFYVGDDLAEDETFIIKANDLYIVTYFGFPLYFSRDGSDIQGKEANNGRYYSINVDGTVNFSKKKRILVYTNDFELYFNGTINSDSKLSIFRISYGFLFALMLFIYLN